MTQWDEQVVMLNISYRCGGMNWLSISLAHSVNAPARVGVLRCFHADLLSDIVEAIWGCDTPDGDLAKGLRSKGPRHLSPVDGLIWNPVRQCVKAPGSYRRMDVTQIQSDDRYSAPHWSIRCCRSLP